MFKEICANFTTFLVCTRADAIDKLVQQDERFTGIAPGRFDGYRTEKEAIGEALREVGFVFTFGGLFSNGKSAYPIGIISKIPTITFACDICDSDVEAEVLPILEVFRKP